jgi:hypothetical protein
MKVLHFFVSALPWLRARPRARQRRHGVRGRRAPLQSLNGLKNWCTGVSGGHAVHVIEEEEHK